MAGDSAIRVGSAVLRAAARSRPPGARPAAARGRGRPGCAGWRAAGCCPRASPRSRGRPGAWPRRPGSTLRPGGHDHHGQGGVEGPQAGEEVEPLPAGGGVAGVVEVHQHHVELAGGDGLDDLGGRGGGLDLVALALEQEAEGLRTSRWSSAIRTRGAWGRYGGHPFNSYLPAREQKGLPRHGGSERRANITRARRAGTLSWIRHREAALLQLAAARSPAARPCSSSTTRPSKRWIDALRVAGEARVVRDHADRRAVPVQLLAAAP